MSKIGVIGDIHGNSFLLNKAVEFLKTKNLSIYSTGDIPGYDGNIDECVSILQYNDVITIKGNHDDWLEDDGRCSITSYKYIKNLPVTYEIHTDIGTALLCHGMGTNNMSKINPDDYGYAIETNFELQELIYSHYYLIINGHSHKKMARTISGLHLVNAGALIHQDPGFIIIDLIKLEVEFYIFVNNEIQYEKKISL